MFYAKVERNALACWAPFRRRIAPMEAYMVSSATTFAIPVFVYQNKDQ